MAEGTKRAGLLGLGLLLALALLEALLQLAALGLSAVAGTPPERWLTGARRVLCVGDSNTYGLYLEDREREAFAARLEALWNEEDAPEVEVLNLGFPGMNSSRVLRELPRMLDALEPELVIALVGANDGWTEVVPIEPEPDPSAWQWIRRHSRTLRTWALLRARLTMREVEVEPPETSGLEAGETVIRYGDYEFRPGWKREGVPTAEVPARAAQLEENLLELAATARRAGVPLALLTYPSERRLYGWANVAIRRAAERSGAHLVELDREFEARCEDATCATLLHRDHHPRAAGHRLIAETLAAQLPRPGA